jgi:hypothetical protein
VSVPAARVASTGGSPGSWWIFGAGLVLFLVFQTGLVLDVQLSRALPPEAKDAYRYIYSALQLRQGFDYDTPALKDLRTQSAPEPGDSVDRQNLKWDNYHSLFFTHVIFHSALLVATSWISGVSLGLAYKISAVLGSLLIAGAIAFFLLTITDRTSAGVALASLAVTMFPMQGIHYVVPTNISLAVGLLLLAVVLRRGGRSTWLLFVLSFIVILMHRMGIIYAGLGVLATVFLRYKEENPRQIFLRLCPTLAIMGLYVLVTYIFPLPMFRLSPMAKPPDTSYFKEVWANFLDLMQLFGGWFMSHGVITVPEWLANPVIWKFSPPTQDLIRGNWGWLFLGSQFLGLGLLLFPWLWNRGRDDNLGLWGWLLSFGGALLLLPVLSAAMLAVIVWAGLRHPSPAKRTSFYLTLFTFVFLLFPSLLHVMYIAEPGHPIIRADLTNRLWVPAAVVLAAVLGQGWRWVIQKIRSGSLDFPPQFIINRGPFQGLRQPRTLWAILLIFLLLGYAPQLVQAYQERAHIKNFMLIRQNVAFDQGQIQWLYDHTKPQDIIVYDDDFIRHYYLCHGGLERRALYLPLLPLPKNFTFAPQDIKYEVGWNPYLAVQHYENVRAITYPLNIPGGSAYQLTLAENFQPVKLQLLPGDLPAGGASAKVRLIRKSATGVEQAEDLHLQGGNWQTFPLTPEQGGSLTLINLDPEKPLLIAGLRFGEPSSARFFWPWQGVVEVSLQDKQLNIQRVAFFPDQRKIGGAAYDLEVLQDTGSTVLWRLVPVKGG